MKLFLIILALLFLVICFGAVISVGIEDANTETESRYFNLQVICGSDTLIFQKDGHVDISKTHTGIEGKYDKETDTYTINIKK